MKEGVRGMGCAVARAATLKRGALREARRSVAPHLPRAGFFTPTLVREVPIRETNFWFLQASARATAQVAADVATRDRWRHAHAHVEHATAVRTVARRCARERILGLGSACGGGMQPSAIASLLKSRVEPSGNLLKKQGETRAW